MMYILDIDIYIVCIYIYTYKGRLLQPRSFGPWECLKEIEKSKNPMAAMHLGFVVFCAVWGLGFRILSSVGF